MATSGALRTERFTTRRSARCAVRGPVDPAQVRELWFVLHGYGQLAADFAAGFDAVDDGQRLIVAPEALSRFYDARASVDRHAEATVGASWMTREERSQEIDDYLAWLQVAYESFRGQVGGGVPVTVLGFSQGAAAASRWVATGLVQPSRLICWGASLAPELDLSARSPLRRTRCTIVVGATDRFISAAQVLQERTRLEAAGFPHEFLEFAGGHRLDDETLRRCAGGT